MVAPVRVEMLRDPNATFVALAEQVPTSATAGAEISSKNRVGSHKQLRASRRGKAASEGNKRLGDSNVPLFPAASEVSSVPDIC